MATTAAATSSPETMRRPPTRLLRSAYGTPSVEAFMLIAILTILLTRAYLEITNYPQVGGGSLHIAHALYGGALMMAALIVGWMFVGFGVRVAAVVLGGIGLGLFLDEVGKFVTKDNDYFYGPAAEIMYVVVVLVLVLGRLVRDSRPPTPQECLANAAAIAAGGIAQGLPDARREWAQRLLDRARVHDADPAAVAAIESLLARCAPSKERLRTAQTKLPTLVPNFVKSPRWVPVAAWFMVVAAGVTTIFGAIALAAGGVDVERDDLTFQLDELTVAGGILWISACFTFALGAPALIALRRSPSLWPLRWLRTAALVSTMLNALVDFAQEGFAALINMAIGLLMLAIFTYRLKVRTLEETGSKRIDDVRL